MSSVKTISELMLSFGSMSNKKIQKIYPVAGASAWFAARGNKEV